MTSDSQASYPLPSGWRAAEKSDYLAENLSTMKNRGPNHVKTDLNGDGINDNAWILINETENKFGLFVFLGKKDGSYEMVNLSLSRAVWLVRSPANNVPNWVQMVTGESFGECFPVKG